MTNFMGHLTFTSFRHRSLKWLKGTQGFFSVLHAALNFWSYKGAVLDMCKQEEWKFVHS
jgi:hypothetical protein